MWKHAGSQGSVCQSLGWCRHQQQVPPLGISTMAWLSDFQWKQMSTLSLRRTYGTQILAAEFYFIMSSNLPLWSELGAWKGRGQLSGRVAWVPRIVPQTCLKMSVFRVFSASGFKKKWSVKIKVGMGRVWGRKSHHAGSFSYQSVYIQFSLAEWGELQDMKHS